MVRAQDIVRADGLVVHRKPLEGDMRWDGKVWRRWNGRRWATAAYSVAPARLQDRSRPDSWPTISRAAARAFLMKAVEAQVATNGATVVLDNGLRMILGYRKRVPHGLFAVFSVLTAGLGTVAWVAASLNRGEQRVQLSIDDWGNVWAKPVADS
jgi:diacylglycerol kinase family enzyme